MMQIGLLWYDGDPHRGVMAKVEDAANRYRQKFGNPPDTCYVNPAELGGQNAVIMLPGNPQAALRVLPTSNVLPNHYWIGIEENVVRSA